MSLQATLRSWLVGKPLDPLSKETRHSIALVAFFAWVGLGADGISSSCYGPEESFRALGTHTGLGLYPALATAATVFNWWRRRGEQRKWIARLALSASGFIVCSFILAMLLVEKFTDGGWLTALIIGAIIGICLTIRRHYNWARAQIRKVDEKFANEPFGSVVDAPKPDPSLPTAVFMVRSSRGGGLYALLWVQRMFPDHFRNFVFVNARTVDSHAYGGSEDMKIMQMESSVPLTYFVNFCNSKGWAAKSYLAFGTDPVDEVARLAEQVHAEFPNCIFFASKLVFERENWLIRLLHNEAALALQRRLHLHGLQMVILPMKI